LSISTINKISIHYRSGEKYYYPAKKHEDYTKFLRAGERENLVKNQI